MATFLKSFEGRRVLVTGHTGFKGSWLSEWLIGLGSDVWGFSLPPATKPDHFTQIGLAARMNHIVGDIRNPAAIRKAVTISRPDYVFHLAAQPIVRTAHDEPTETWSTNVMGTVHVLDALRKLNRPCAAVIVTTDKVYGTADGVRVEKHPSSAKDIYGASKAAAEVAVEAWRHSFYRPSAEGQAHLPVVAVATARSGNVIGGGDWAKDRILPDCIRALMRGRPIVVRNPASVRPWQHVLDPLCGYLSLASELRKALELKDGRRVAELSGPFNFGPAAKDHRTVEQLVNEVLGNWPGTWIRRDSGHPAIETPVLRLNARKAARLLGWKPRWNFETTVENTVGWYAEATSSPRALAATLRQITSFADQ